VSKVKDEFPIQDSPPVKPTRLMRNAAIDLGTSQTLQPRR